MTSFAFLVSGCGVYCGTENNELTLALLSVAQSGGKEEIFAPNEEYNIVNTNNNNILHNIVDPFGKNTDNIIKGNMLFESAKITRGKVKDLKELNVKNFDCLVLPGGYGVIKNFSNIEEILEGKTVELKINHLVREAIVNFHNAKKPILAICIAPLLVASVIQDCKITLGSSKNRPKNYPIHLNYEECSADSFCFDEENLIFEIVTNF